MPALSTSQASNNVSQSVERLSKDERYRIGELMTDAFTQTINTHEETIWTRPVQYETRPGTLIITATPSGYVSVVDKDTSVVVIGRQIAQYELPDGQVVSFPQNAHKGD